MFSSRVVLLSQEPTHVPESGNESRSRVRSRIAFLSHEPSRVPESGPNRASESGAESRATWLVTQERDSAPDSGARFGF